MATEQHLFKLSGLVASADLRTHQFKFVKLYSTAGQVAAIAAATDLPIGVLQNKPNTGEACEIVCIGKTKLQADAALATIGTQIGTSADGQADAKVNGTDPTEYVLGQTLSAAANAGEIISAVINCVNPPRAVTAN